MDHNSDNKRSKTEGLLVFVTIIVTFFHAVSHLIKDIAEYLGKE